MMSASSNSIPYPFQFSNRSTRTLWLWIILNAAFTLSASWYFGYTMSIVSHSASLDRSPASSSTALSSLPRSAHISLPASKSVDPEVFNPGHSCADRSLTLVNRRRLFDSLWHCPDPDFKPVEEHHSQMDEDKMLWGSYIRGKSLHDTHKNPGFFIEIGALDGWEYSNTWFYEKYLDWRGLLIEAQPANAKVLRKRTDRPNTVRAGMAVCSPPTESIEFLGGAGAVSGAVGDMSDSFRSHWHNGDSNVYKVPCAPLSAILPELGITHVDYFSLDVEGAELSVLNTFPFDKVSLHYLLLERNEKTPKIIEKLSALGMTAVPWSEEKFRGNQLFINESFVEMDFNQHCIPY